MKRRVLGALLVTLFIAAASILPSASAYVGSSEQAELSSTQPSQAIYCDDLKADIFTLANGNRLMLGLSVLPEITCMERYPIGSRERLRA